MAITVMNTGIDTSGMLNAILASKQLKQRKKESKRTHAVAEAGIDVAKGELALGRDKQTFEEKKFDALEAFREAQTNYMEAITNDLMNKELQKRRLDLENRRVTMDENVFSQEMKKQYYLEGLMTSDNDTEKEWARNLWLGYKENQDLNAQINLMRLDLEQQSAFFNRALDLSKFENDSLRTGLSIMEGVLSREAQIKKGKDKEFRESFDAGVQAATENLLGTPSSGGAAETKPVGSSKAFSAPGMGSAGWVSPPPQMTLDQALDAFKGGNISGEDLLSAWPSLADVIDKSLLAPSEVPSFAPTAPTGGSYEQDLIKRLQQ